MCCQAEEERDGMEKVKLDNRRILFNLLPAHVAQHFLLSNPRNMVSFANRQVETDRQAGSLYSCRKVINIRRHQDKVYAFILHLLVLH